MNKIPRPEIALFHPNAKGTGSAMKISVIPASIETGNYQGYLDITIAMQADPATPSTFPRFDWENRETARLGISDIGEVLQVFRGYNESIKDGKGLLLTKTDHPVSFHMTHRLEPVPGFLFEIVNPRKTAPFWFVMNPAEAIGIQCAIEGILHIIAFGEPKFAGKED